MGRRAAGGERGEVGGEGGGGGEERGGRWPKATTYQKASQGSKSGLREGASDSMAEPLVRF